MVTPVNPKAKFKFIAVPLVAAALALLVLVTPETPAFASVNVIGANPHTAPIRPYRTTEIVTTPLRPIDVRREAPIIITQPANASVVMGNTVFLDAAANGAPFPREKWYYEVDGTSTWIEIPGATDNVLEIMANPQSNETQYKAIFTNTYGTKSSNVASVVAYQSTDIWSGYVQTGSVFSAASATWTVPVVTCAPGSSTAALQWVGIDGYGNNTVEQIGTETACADGAPTYDAWYEMWGDDALNNGFQIPLANSVEPGDVMSASVNLTGTTWTLTITDETQNWTSANEVISPSPTPEQSSAEVIVERPLTCVAIAACAETTISDIAPVTFSSMNFISSDEATTATTALTMQDPGVGSLTPSALSENRDSFSVSFQSATS